MALAPTQSLVETPSRLFYREAMEVLNRAGVPFLVGGAFAFIHQAGIDKSTKDLDLFARPRDVQRLLEACAAAGYETELVFSHWLAKIRSPEGFIDVIFSSGNGIATVDDGWFEHATAGTVLGVHGQDRPAGGDDLVQGVRHGAGALRRRRRGAPDPGPRRAPGLETVSWPGSVRTGGCSWPTLILFGFIFPSERSRVPGWVMEELLQRAEAEQPRPMPPSRSATAPCSPGPSTWAMCWADHTGTPGFAHSAHERRRGGPVDGGG